MASLKVSEQVLDRFLVEQLHKEPEARLEYHNTMTPATRLLEKRKELLDVQAALDAQKEDYTARVEKAEDSKRSLLTKSEMLLTIRSQKDDFANNRAKEIRMRMESKAGYEAEVRQAEINTKKLQDQLDSVNRELAEKKAKFEKMEQYKKYLDAFKGEEEAELFEEISSIILRYESLEEVKSRLDRDTKRHNANDISQKDALKRAMGPRRDQIMTYSGEVDFLEEELRTLDIKAGQLEKELENIIERSTDEIRTLGRCQLAVGNIYQQMCDSRLGFYSRRKEEDAIGQLTVVSHFLEDLRSCVAVLSEANRRGGPR